MGENLMGQIKRLNILWLVFVLTVLAAIPVRIHAGGASDITLEVIEKSAVIRDQPSATALEITILEKGSRLIWTGATKQVAGRNWLEVRLIDGSGPYWTAPDNEILFTADPTDITMQMDLAATFKPAAGSLTLREQASIVSNIVVQVPANTPLTVSDGPISADLFTWWQATTPDGKLGWFSDSPFTGNQIITPLKVYGYNVCDGFKIKTYGATGWDSIVDVLPTLIPAGQTVTCLASTNLKGDKTPVVVVLSREESDTNPHDTLTIFDNSSGKWASIWQSHATAFSRTQRLFVYDFANAGNGKPMLVWMIRNDGTGGVLDLNIFNWTLGVGIENVFNRTAYKGSIQINGPALNVLEASYKENEPNCCASGLHRVGFTWDVDKFRQVIEDTFTNPYWLQGPPQ
jgi:hypothetical protein